MNHGPHLQPDRQRWGQHDGAKEGAGREPEDILLWGRERNTDPHGPE